MHKVINKKSGKAIGQFTDKEVESFKNNELFEGKLIYRNLGADKKTPEPKPAAEKK